MPFRIFLTGATGFVGTFLTNYLRTLGGYELVMCTQDILGDDLVVPDVDAVVHLAAKPISFGGDPSIVFDTGYRGTVNLARQTPPGAQFVFLSSELVFKSDAARIYQESDIPEPETAYGKAKAAAETFLLEEWPGTAILRSSTLYGYAHPRRQNFFTFVLGRLQKGEPVDVYSDVYSSPLFLGDLCAMIRRLMDHRLTGIYHASGREYVSRAEIARRICAIGGFRSDLIVPSARPLDVHIPQSTRLGLSRVFEEDLKHSLEDGIRLWLDGGNRRGGQA